MGRSWWSTRERGRALWTDFRAVLTREGEISWWLGDREYVQEKK